MKVEFSQLVSTNHELIALISNWYEKEWSIPKNITADSFVDIPNSRVIFQTIMTLNGVPIGTGGIYRKVGIQDKVKKYGDYEPWLALMYTTPEVRGTGLGGQLLAAIEMQAQQYSLDKIYLFTHTAKSLYLKNSWDVEDEFLINERVITVMKKEFFQSV